MELMYIAQRWFQPCTSETIGSLLLPECKSPSGFVGGWSITSNIYLAVLCLLSFWFNIDAFGTYVYYLASLSFTWVNCFCIYIRVFNRNVMADSLNPSRVRSPLVYRELQLLNRFLNCIQQDLLLPLILYFNTIAFVLSMYVLISRGTSLGLPELFMFSQASVNTFVVTLVFFTVSAMVNTESKAAIKYFHSKVVVNVNPAGRGKRWGRKFFMSLPPLKVGLGSVNFVDKLTPITLFNFSFSQIVSLLLVE